MMDGLDVVVLAGGDSSRMGTDKMLLPVGGVRLVDRVVAAVADTRGIVVLAAGRRNLHVAGVDTVPDPGEVAGPLAGVVAGLRATFTDLVGVVAADIPRASLAVLEGLARLAREADADAAVPMHDGHPQVLHAVYHRRLLRRFELAASGRGSLRALLDDVHTLRVDPSTWSAWDRQGGFGQDWDEPDDLPDTVRREAGLDEA